MTTTHAPGPWAHHNHQSPLIYSKTTGEYIAQVFEFDNGTRGHLRKGDAAADARLICAAPALLDTLSRIVHEFDLGRTPIARDLSQARAALALATTGA